MLFILSIYSLCVQSLLELTNQHGPMTKKSIPIVTNNELLCIDFDLGASVDNTHLMHMLADIEVATSTGNTTSRTLLCNFLNEPLD